MRAWQRVLSIFVGIVLILGAVGLWHARQRRLVIKMWGAILDEDADTVRGLARSRTLIRHRNLPDKRTFLHLASCTSSLEVITALCDAGADVNALDKFGNAPLCMAAQRGRAKVVRVLLDHGADPEATDAFGHSPLFWAVQTCNIESVKSLLERGADPDGGAESWSAPLHTAALLDQVRIAEELLSCGADVNATDAKGNTPLDTARAQSNQALIELLCDHGARSRGQMDRSRERP